MKRTHPVSSRLRAVGLECRNNLYDVTAYLCLSISAKESRLHLYHTALPEALGRVKVRNLRIRESVIDIAFERYAETVGVNVLRRSGDVGIL
jgi:hypothetical protein